MKIEKTLSPKGEDIDFLTGKLNDENASFGGLHPFAFFIRDKENHIIAGCSGYFVFGVVHTAQLWVHSECRKQGLGRSLMEKVHEYGRETGCAMSTLSTMTFQGAKGFYEKLGYKVDLKRDGYANDSSCLFLKKNL